MPAISVKNSELAICVSISRLVCLVDDGRHTSKVVGWYATILVLVSHVDGGRHKRAEFSTKWCNSCPAKSTNGSFSVTSSCSKILMLTDDVKKCLYKGGGKTDFRITELNNRNVRNSVAFHLSSSSKDRGRRTNSLSGQSVVPKNLPTTEFNNAVATLPICQPTS